MDTQTNSAKGFGRHRLSGGGRDRTIGGRLGGVLAWLLGVTLVLGLGPRAAAQGRTPEVVVSAEASKASLTPGDQFAVAVVFRHAPGWHVHTNAPVVPPELGDFEPIPTTVEVRAPEGVLVGPVQWPAVKMARVEFGPEPVDYGVFEGEAAAFVPIVLTPAFAGGAVRLEVLASYQACDDTICLAPEEFTATIELAVGPTPAPGAAPAVFAGFDPSVFASMLSGSVATSDGGGAGSKGTGKGVAPEGVRFDAFGLGFTIDPRGGVGLVLLMLVAALGGFLLNLTPCVLPVVPIKIMGLSKSAGNPGRCLYLGVVMSLGVVAFFVAIGAVIAFSTSFKAISTLMSLWWFTLGIAVFIAVMGLGMLGAFTVQLPQAVYAVNPSHDSTHGSFLFGVMTAVLSTPCTAPFMGTAAAAAARMPPAITLSVFGAIGLGMALPYLVLAARPRWVNKVPRTGPASELVKQVMGLLMLAVSVFFVGSAFISLTAERPYLGPVLHWWGTAALGGIAGLWLVVRTFQITRSAGKRAAWGVVGLGIAGALGWWAVYQTGLARSTHVEVVESGGGDREGLWARYTPEALAGALGAGRVVVVDFTAEWCLNCKVLEATVLNRDDVRSALSGPGVVTLKADLTSRKDPGWALLDELGHVGIPLIAVIGPGTGEWFTSNAYTPEQVIGAVRRASGESGGG